MPISSPSTETELLDAGIRALVLRSFDAGARTRRLKLPYWDTESASCHLLDGEADGRPHRVLVGKVRHPGGEAVLFVRRFAARRKSLSGGAAVLCVHGELSGEAMLLAAREGIQVVTSGDDGIRIHTGSAVLARHVSVEEWSVAFSAAGGRERELRIDSATGGDRASMKGRPFANWMRKASRKLLRNVAGDCVLRAEYRLGRPSAVSSGSRSLDCGAFTVWCACRVRFRVHVEYVEPARAKYDARKQRIVLADGELPHAAEFPIGAAGEGLPQDAGAGSPKLDFHVFHPVRGLEGEGVPDIETTLEALSVAVEAGGLAVRDLVPDMDPTGRDSQS